MSESILVLIKPDAVSRHVEMKILEDILSLLNNDVKIDDIKTMEISRENAELHYEEHKGKDFFDRTCSLISAGPLVKIIFTGNNIIKRMNEVKPEIRKKYAETITRNCIHVSDSLESAAREINLWNNIIPQKI